MDNFVIVENNCSLADLAIAVKMKFGYVNMSKININYILIDGVLKIKATVN